MWVGVVIAVLNLLANLPELIEKLRDVFETFKRVPKMKVVYEAAKLKRACEAKAKANLAGEPCPVDAFLEDLKRRYP